MEKLPQTAHKFDMLLCLEKIEHCHLKALGPDDKTAFMDMLYNRLAKLAECERDEELNALVAKAAALLDNEFIWEHNHAKIMKAMRAYTRANGTVPTKAYLASTCGLNRKTIQEHLKAFNGNATGNDQNEAINIMSHDIMGTVIKAALNGDMKAAKLYFDTTKVFKPNEIKVSTQNNFVQINKTVINQQVIQQLKPEQLQLIEQIIAGM